MVMHCLGILKIKKKRQNELRPLDHIFYHENKSFWTTTFGGLLPYLLDAGVTVPEPWLEVVGQTVRKNVVLPNQGFAYLTPGGNYATRGEGVRS